MQKSPINPWQWSLNLGYNQAELVKGGSQQLFIAGQTSVDAGGIPQHADDVRAQVSLALDNLESVLTSAGMNLSNVVKLGIYATDVDALMPHFDVLAQRLGAAQANPPMTLLGVNRLALADLHVEIEATAVA